MRSANDSSVTRNPFALQPVAATLRLMLCVAPSLAAMPAAADDLMPAAPAEVVIVGTAARPYAAQASSTATKTDTPLIDTPQAITVITRELMQDQAMQSMADVIRYVPGVVTAQGEGNRDTAVFRGNSSTSDFYIDGMRDDVQYFRDFYNIESVEALKGSNAMIFGRGGSGGVINRVSKEPVWREVREASVSAGSWKNRRATVDVGQALGASVAVRINAMAEDSDSYRDGVSIKRSGVNPTMAFKLGARTRAVIGYEHFEDERVADRGVPSYQGKPLDTDVSTFFGNAGSSPTWVDVDAFNALVDHEFDNGVTLRNRTRYADYDKFYQNVFPGAVNAAGTSVAISAYSNATQRKNLFNQTDLTYVVDTGAVRHKLLAGTELGSQETDNLRMTGYYLGVSPTTTSMPVPVANPLQTLPITFKQSATDAKNHGKATVASVYVQDQVEFSPQWLAVVGLRYDRFKVDFLNQRTNATIVSTDTPVSPRAGLVYKPAANMSLYGSYSIAYVPRAGEQLSSLSATNQAFEPEEFKNLELGAKWDVTPSLALTGAVYRLDRSNVAITDPADPTRTILVDGQVSKGVELGVAGNITTAWSVMGGYAFQDAKITRTQSATAREGARLAQVPEHSLSLWNRYDFTPSFAAALGFVYRDEIFASTSNTVSLPSFIRVDGALFYTINKNLRLQLNVENLLDKKYYASAHSNDNITPGSPRAVKLGLIAKF
ncbi:MAG TPA: TonB-dependent siderophore receptor [Telluria sp.]|nr:TonB-dependent siderophore receptor [Telluria sp.]